MVPEWWNTVVPFRISYEESEFPNEDQWREKLKSLKHIRIKPSQERAFGFSSLCGYEEPDNDEMLLVHGSYLLINMTFEDKHLNQSQLSRRLAEMKSEKAKLLGLEIRDLPKADIKEMRNTIKKEMYRETDATETYMAVLIDTANDLLFFSGNVGKQHGDTFTLLEKIIPSLKHELFQAEGVNTDSKGISVILTAWLQDNTLLPREATLVDSARFEGINMASASMRKQNLQSEEILSLIDIGQKHVMEVAIIYLKRVEFRLNHICHLKGFKAIEEFKSEMEVNNEAVGYLNKKSPVWQAMFAELTDIYAWLDDIRNGIVQDTAAA